MVSPGFVDARAPEAMTASFHPYVRTHLAELQNDTAARLPKNRVSRLGPFPAPAFRGTRKQAPGRLWAALVCRSHSPAPPATSGFRFPPAARSKGRLHLLSPTRTQKWKESETGVIGIHSNEPE